MTVVTEDSHLDPRRNGAVRRRAQIERVRLVHHRHGRQFGHAVYACRGDTLLLTALHHRARHRGSATGKHSQRQPDPSISRSLGQLLQEYRRAGRVSHPVRHDLLDRPAGIPPLCEHRAGPHQQWDRHCIEQSGDVLQWGGHVGDIVPAQPPRIGELTGFGQQRARRVHGGLGARRGTGGEQDQARFIDSDVGGR